ncbi:MAG: alpha/beta fold hydrolase [Acidobacteria bacterium]|nr:alpha/beta fold hydrolase [Acidobacteriota bacterium]
MERKTIGCAPAVDLRRPTAPVCTIAAVAVALLIATTGCRGTRHGQVLTIDVPAPALQGSVFPNGARQPCLVYLPPSYEGTTGRYPVLYYLPGFTTSVDEYTDGSFDGFELGESMDLLIGSGVIREMIVVIPNGRNFLGGSFFANSPVTGDWEDFITKDVVRFIDENYRSLGRPEARAISGESMGGFGALTIAMKHSSIFRQVYALSPGIFAPGGLSECGMSTPDRIEARLTWQAMLDQLPQEEALARFRQHVADLYATGRRFPYHWAFGYAYGAAFAPDPQGKVPFSRFPWVRNGDRVQVDHEAYQLFENGFGGWEAKVAEHAASLKALDGIVIDYGRNDRLEWIPRGCVHLSEVMQAAGIPHELRAHDGGHIDRWRERMETQALPFVSDRFNSH